MGVSDANAVYGDDARFTHKPLSFYKHLTVVSQTGLEIFSHCPGYNFQILGFEVYCVAYTAVTSFNLLIGAVSVLTAVLVPVAGIHTEATILSTGVEYGDDDDIVFIQYTSDAAGVVGEASFQIWIRRRAQDIT